MGNRLADKVAIVTGGNSGIGKTTAEIFAGEGASVILMARRKEQAKRSPMRFKKMEEKLPLSPAM